MIGIAFGSCQSRPNTPDPASSTEGEALFGGSAEARRSSGQAEAWTIVVYGYRTETRAEDARAGLDWITRNTGMTGFRIEDRGEATVIAYGHYRDPKGADAIADYERLRQIEVDGAYPFAESLITPPEYAGLGNHPEYDLRRIREAFPDAVYSLQIGFYGSPGQLISELPPEAQQEIRAAGEQAAVALRREGELAFYYHGPSGTMVTVGAFEEDDIDLARQYESPAVKALRQRFPYNLVNGHELRQRLRRSASDEEGVWVTQSSRPILIPR
ncbi:MAG: hypothetical protein ACF8R7_00080 [Phycisphaerales bacterium JB039]